MSCLQSWHLIFILKMNDPRAVSSDLGPIDNSTTEGQLGSLAIQTASDSVCQPSNLVELSCVEQQIPDVIGLHVSKRFSGVMYEGIVESYDNISEMFKVVYFIGLSEEMRWEDLMKYLVHREQPLPLSSNELANKDHDTGNSLALVALAPKSRKPGRTRKQSRPVKREVAKNACPPKQAGRRGRQPSASDDEGSETGQQRSIIKYETSEVTSLRRSTRKRKELGYTYCEDSTDEDELVDDDEADYALPPIVQVPWVDWVDEPPPKGPMKGICTSKGYKGPTKKQWVSLRISADAKPKDGQKKPAAGDRKD